MPRGPTTYWEIYDAQLSHIGRGITLWHPGPYEGDDGQITPIRLGDVGYMMQGRFVTLFNVSEASRPNGPNPCDPYPESKLLDVLPIRSSEKSFTSKSVKATVVDLDVADPKSTNIQVSAKLICEKEAGAALLLPGRKRPKFHSLNLKYDADYREYCLRHCEEWLKSSDSAARYIELKDLIFVTGIDNVYAWSLFSFQRQSQSCAFKLTAGLSTVSGALDIQDSSIEHAPMMNFGPEDRPQNEEPSLPDQTVFVRRLKIHGRVDRLKWRMWDFLQVWWWCWWWGWWRGWWLSWYQVEMPVQSIRMVTAPASGSEASSRTATITSGTIYADAMVQMSPGDESGSGGASNGPESSPSLARTEGNNLVASSPRVKDAEATSTTSQTTQGSRTDVPTIPISPSPSSSLFPGPSHRSSLSPNMPTSPPMAGTSVPLLVVPATSSVDHGGSDGSTARDNVDGEAVNPKRVAQETSQKEKKKSIRPHERGGSFTDDKGGPSHRRGGGPGGAGGGGSSAGGSAGGGGGAGTGQGLGGEASSSRLPGNSGHHYQGSGGGKGHTRGYRSAGWERTETEGVESGTLDGCIDEERNEDSDESGSENLDTEPLDPLDALLEYMLEVCPDAKYSCAGDDDLLQFKDYLSADWLAFPELLRKLKPEIALRPDRLAVLVKGPVLPKVMDKLADQQLEDASYPPSFMPTESTKVNSIMMTPLNPTDLLSETIRTIGSSDGMHDAANNRQSVNGQVQSTLISPTVDTPSSLDKGLEKDEAVTRSNNLPSHDAVDNSNNQPHDPAVRSSKSKEFTADDIVNPTLWRKSSNYGLDIRGLDLQKLVAEDDQTTLSAILDILSDRERKRGFLDSCRADPVPTLNLLQTLLDREDVSPSQRSTLMQALTHLAKVTTRYPDSLFLSGIHRIERHPVAGGRFADVWKGNLNSSCVAMKALRMFNHSEKALKNFCHEAVIWRQLKHPNILPFLGVFKGDTSFDHLCLISPWMDGGNVMDYLTHNPDVHRLPLLADVLNGLFYLHSFQPPIIHGDLNGANILITPSHNACLGGFNQLRFQDSLEDTSDLRIGALRWQAPELLFRQVGGEMAHPSAETDVYSFGCVCLELMTGKHPFSEITEDFGVLVAIKDKRTPERPTEDLQNRGLDDNLWAVMTQCWDHDPTRRPGIRTLLEFFENQKKSNSQSKISRG